MKLDKIYLKETENIVETCNPIPSKRSERVTVRAQEPEEPESDRN